MPAQEFKTQIPGEPLATTTPATSTGATTQTPVVPTYTAKHNGGGRWKVWLTPAEGHADWFSDFVGVSREEAEAEVIRLTEGGAPLVLDPLRMLDSKPTSQATSTVDATTLKQPVLTGEGWLCPEPVVKG
ncbi:hypothetical protein GHO29_19760 [Pseudomonas helleri]|uniref:Uncharacterized protein n=1 Tax=Pseudomonas helleri TaxID=1608996 RepID=A0A7X2CF17_9PSED|nr:hypothetical protein [Pseudomonas helleri]MQU28713.1 hypothetical protein [Pseudomonas helleri]